MVDSIHCRACQTGTYSPTIGATDLSQCYPCPQGRICGNTQMSNLSDSRPCDEGYVCGFNTDKSTQFSHMSPAGYWTPPEAIPAKQLDNLCAPGYYCTKGTSQDRQERARCTIGSYCPESTPDGTSVEVKCPLHTTTLNGAKELSSCRIADVHVCDKQDTDVRRPMEDNTYYPIFSYSLLDDSANKFKTFDSSQASSNPTGEIKVVRKIMPVNPARSSAYWVNDTIEAFRTCPLYGSGNGGEYVQIVGRNFRDTNRNFCKWYSCISSNEGRNPRRCRNNVNQVTGEPLPAAGDVSRQTFLTPARFISKTRMECQVPEFTFSETTFVPLDHDVKNCYYIDSNGVVKGFPDGDLCENACKWIDANGDVAGGMDSHEEGVMNEGNYSYVRSCYDIYDCQNKPRQGLEYFQSLTFPCTLTEIADKVCPGVPEIGYTFNPCISNEALVEVSNDGEMFSGGYDLNGVEIQSTVRQNEDTAQLVDNYQNKKISATFAVYTYVQVRLSINEIKFDSVLHLTHFPLFFPWSYIHCFLSHHIFTRTRQ